MKDALFRLLEALPRVIESASESHLGIVALVVVALTMLAYLFFSEDKPAVRISVFTALLVSGAMLSAVLLVAQGAGARSEASSLLGNGLPCKADSECLSRACYPGPGEAGAFFCEARASNCAFPGSSGYRYGNTVDFEGQRYICARPTVGRARWFRL